MKKYRNLLVFVPIAFGAFVSVAAQVFFAPVPLLAFKVDMGMAIFVLGAFGTLVLGAAALGRESRARSARREAQELRRDLEERRRSFIRRLDHEIKNPLTGLGAALVNMQEATQEGDRQRAGENARHAIERLKRLLADLRKLAELEERPLERLPVDIPELL